MKKSFVFAVAVLVCGSVLMTGCAMVRSPAMGLLYTEVKDGVAINPAVGSAKVGKATVTTVLGLVATGDASIEAAAKAGNIKKINHVDYESKSILGIYGTYTTVVYGE